MVDWNSSMRKAPIVEGLGKCCVKYAAASAVSRLSMVSAGEESFQPPTVKRAFHEYARGWD
jgi:hypothetical protein